MTRSQSPNLINTSVAFHFILSLLSQNSSIASLLCCSVSMAESSSDNPEVNRALQAVAQNQLSPAFPSSIILDEEFLQTYQHGIVITSPDGVKRRFYPRFSTYSADCPEK
jgi:hypothetical protein